MVNPARSVSVIDPVQHTVIGTATDVDAGAIALDGRSAWVVDAGPAITRIDRTATVKQRIQVPAISLSGLAIADGAAWAVDPYGGLLYRIQLPGGNVVTTIRVGQGAEAVAADGARSGWQTRSQAWCSGSTHATSGQRRGSHSAAHHSVWRRPQTAYG